jgi:hypothetical protein
MYVCMYVSSMAQTQNNRVGREVSTSRCAPEVEDWCVDDHDDERCGGIEKGKEVRGPMNTRQMNRDQRSNLTLHLIHRFCGSESISLSLPEKAISFGGSKNMETVQGPSPPS